MIDPDSLPPHRLVARVVRAARAYQAVVLDGSSRVAQLAAGLIARRGHPPVMVLADATWKAGDSGVERLARRTSIRAIDGPRVFYCVLSSEEVELFPRTWAVDPARVSFTPWHYAFSEEELALPTSGDGGVFAGGDSLRDYGPLVAAARGLPAEVTIASTQVSGEDLPPNVRAGPVPHERFMDLLRRATVVVVALGARRDRSAGQQTYLNAMAMGKPVIVTDALGVRDYIEDGRTGIVVPPGDPAALLEKLEWALDPANREEVRELAARGREAALSRFGPDSYVESLLRVVDQAVQ
jgi:hypothetical protein